MGLLSVPDGEGGLGEQVVPGLQVVLGIGAPAVPMRCGHHQVELGGVPARGQRSLLGQEPGEVLAGQCTGWRDVAGRSALDPMIVDGLVNQRAHTATSPVSTLTDRELDVLRAMAEGLSNPAIGNRLHLSTSSIEKYVNAIFGKLGLPPETQVHRRVAAVMTYLRSTITQAD